MDTSDPLIVFDREGRCNHCTEFLNVRLPNRSSGSEGGRMFEALVSKMRTAGTGRDYDCIVGVSGGVDSTYLSYLLHDAGLRLLAVHMDNGWDSEESVSNIKNLTSGLKIDYQSYVLNWEEFRDLQLSFLKASVPEAETPTDVAIPAALHHFAARHNVKYIVSAGNLTTEGILPKAWHYNARDFRYFNYIQSMFGRILLQSFPKFDYKKEAYLKLVRGIRVVYPMNLIDPPKGGMMPFLVDAFDYKPSGAKHHESRYTRFIQSYYLYEKFGIDYRRAKFSSQICSDQANREHALEQLSSKPYDDDVVELEKQYIAKKLKLDRDDLERIISLPPKWYWEYPNDEKKLQLIYEMYRRLFGKEKLASF